MKPTNTVKEGNSFTGGEWIAVKVKDGWAIKERELHEKGFSDRIAELNHYPDHEQEANARLIAESKNLFKIVGELIQYLEWREDFLIEDSEEGETNVYTQAKAIINRINNQ